MKFVSDTEASEHTEKAHKKESLSCYKCDYETDGPKKLEVHALLLHGIVQCDKCGYGAEDFDILNEHMKKHTGRMIFQCRKCEFEATRQAILDNLIAVKHAQPAPPCKKEMCKHCTKYFPDPFLLKYHSCKQVETSEYAGQRKWMCDLCDYTTDVQTNLPCHTQTNHKVAKVDIEESIKLKCDQCDYSCLLNI